MKKAKENNRRVSSSSPLDTKFGKRIQLPHISGAGDGDAGGKQRGPRLQLLPMAPGNAAAKALQRRELPPIAKGPSFTLAVWPGSNKRVAGGSKAPLALQLEAYIRREHQLYLHEHRNCTHADTLHIVKEVFSVILEHFLEYRGVLSFIREEYEATIEETTSELRRLRALSLENESDRSFHVMELMRQREGFTTVISNQQAQLQAAQGLIHSLRDQVVTLEKCKSDLLAELKRKIKEFEEATQSSKLFANSLIEEAARNSNLMQIHRADEREVGRLNAQVNLLKEKLGEMEKRFNALVRQMMFGGSGPTTSNNSTGPNISEASLTFNSDTDSDKKETDASVIALQRRVDDLLFAYEQLKQETKEAKQNDPSEEEKEIPVKGEDLGSHGGLGPLVASSLNTSSEVIQHWLLDENLTERELDALDYLLPPGKCDGDPLSFLNVCRPVRNLHMKKKLVVSMLRDFWASRKINLHMPLKSYFLHWLRKKAGPERVAEDIGMNVLYVCQRNLEDPECRGMLLTLHSFLPEDLIFAWQKDIRSIEEACQESSRLDNGIIQASFVENAIRVVMPEKSYLHVLELRLYLWRFRNGSERVSVDKLFNENGHFVYILKKQFLYEVEEFTLQVVEAIRSLSEDSTTVRLRDVMETIAKLDPGIPKGTLHRLVAESSQLTPMDVATADASFRVKLQTVLDRFRSSVLLRRATPPLGDDLMIARLKKDNVNGSTNNNNNNNDNNNNNNNNVANVDGGDHNSGVLHIH